MDSSENRLQVQLPLCEVSQLCEQFDQHWSAESVDELPELLKQVEEGHAVTLLRNLLQIELRRRKESGKELAKDDYLARFPVHAAVINQELDVHQSTVLVSMIQDTSVPEGSNRKELTLPGVSRLGDYILEQELGRGAMGVVFAARHAVRGHKVALKTLPTADGDALRRFKQEFRALSTINHPHLVGLHTLQEDGGQWFFTMDQVDGSELLDYVRPDGHLNAGRLRSTLRQIVLGVQALHEHDILHRDLKPSNVMVSGGGEVQLLDFGLVVDLKAGEGEAEIAGTPAYMAPEQFLGQTTASSDWYAVGVILYQALTGTLPFLGSTNEIFRDKQNLKPPTLPAEINGDLRRLCEGLLQRDPSRRLSVSEIHAIACPEEPLPKLAGDKLPKTSHQLLGREKQIAQLESASKEFEAGTTPATIFIGGKSGEGKTVLAEHFLNQFRQDPDTILLSGRCYDRESVPFKAIDTMIDALCVELLRLPDVTVQRMLTPDVAVLTQLFPVLSRVKAISELEPINLKEIEVERIHRLAGAALRDVLYAFGKSKRIVCFIDDLQWGDADSATLLTELLSSSPELKLLFVGTFRSDEAESSRFLESWSTARIEEKITAPEFRCEVQPLSPEECVQLVQEFVGDDSAIVKQHALRFASESGGNPLLLAELASAYDPSADDSQSIRIEDILQNKLQRLPENAQKLLEIVSVSGQPLLLHEASQSIGATTVPFATITRMRSERLVRLVGDEQELTVETYHDRIRELVLRDMQATVQEELHVRLGEVIERSVHNDLSNENSTHNPRVYDLAYHFFEGNDPRAFKYQLEAGEAALKVVAIDDARMHFEKAELKSTSESSDNDLYRLYQLKGEAFGKCQLLDDGLAAFRKSLSYANTSQEKAVAYRGISEMQMRTGRFNDAVHSCDLGLQELNFTCSKNLMMKLAESSALLTLSFFPWLIRPARSEVSRERFALRSELILQLAHSMQMKGDLPGYVHASTWNVYSSLRSGNPKAAANALAKIGFNHATSSLGVFSRWFLRQADSFAQLTEDTTTQGLVTGYIGMSQFNLGQLEEAEDCLKKSLKIIEREGNSWIQVSFHHHLRHVYSVRGDIHNEVEESLIELRLGTLGNDPETISWAEYGLAQAKARKGLLQEAIQHSTGAVQAIRQRPEGVFTEAIMLNHLAFVAMQNSQFEDAVQHLDVSLKIMKKHLIFVEYTLPVFPLLIESLVGPNWLTPPDLQQLRRAKRFVIPSLIVGWRFPTLRAHTQRSCARFFAAQGQTKKAIRYFSKTIDSARSIGAEYQEARALLDLSVVDNVNRDQLRDEAVSLLKQLNAVIPHAEMWQLGPNPDLGCVAPEFTPPSLTTHQ